MNDKYTKRLNIKCLMAQFPKKQADTEGSRYRLVFYKRLYDYRIKFSSPVSARIESSGIFSLMI